MLHYTYKKNDVVVSIIMDYNYYIPMQIACSSSILGMTGRSLLESDMQGRQTGGGARAQLRLIDLCRIGRWTELSSA